MKGSELRAVWGPMGVLLALGACGGAPGARMMQIAGCPTGQTDCSGACTDTGVDSSNCGGCGVACGGGAWCAGGTCVSPAPMPTPRTGLAVVAGSGGQTLYALGGAEIEGGSVLDLATAEAYSPSSNTWSTLPSMLMPRENLAAVAAPDGRIYAIGGDNSGGAVPMGEAYDPTGMTWSALPSMVIPRTALAAAVGPDGRIYAMGGFNAGACGTTYYDDVEAYAPGGQWTIVSPMPTARCELAAATGPDGLIYAIGGENALGPTNAVEAYDTASDTWTRAAALPVARWGVAAAIGPDGLIYAMGGSDPSTGWTAATESLSPGGSGWVSAAPMPTPRGSLGAATGSDGRIYAIGGSGANVNLNTVEAYSPVSGTW